jgi:hypothetical protein
MNDIKLTLQQAIRIRDDFRHLEGEILDESRKYERQIDCIIVGPFEGKLYDDFSKAYDKFDYEERDDEEKLAASYQPEAYSVYTLYFDFQGTGIKMHEHFFETAKAMELEIDLSKYGIKEDET